MNKVTVILGWSIGLNVVCGLYFGFDTVVESKRDKTFDLTLSESAHYRGLLAAKESEIQMIIQMTMPPKSDCSSKAVDVNEFGYAFTCDKNSEGSYLWFPSSIAPQ